MPHRNNGHKNQGNTDQHFLHYRRQLNAEGDTRVVRELETGEGADDGDTIHEKAIGEYRRGYTRHSGNNARNSQNVHRRYLALLRNSCTMETSELMTVPWIMERSIFHLLSSF